MDTIDAHDAHRVVVYEIQIKRANALWETHQYCYGDAPGARALFDSLPIPAHAQLRLVRHTTEEIGRRKQP